MLNSIRYELTASKHCPEFTDLAEGKLFRRARPTNPKKPCLYVKTQKDAAMSLNSGNICYFKPSEPCVEVEVEFRDRRICE